MLSPVVSSVAAETVDKIRVVKVDVDEARDALSVTRAER
jgi:hypothetical protein